MSQFSVYPKDGITVPPEAAYLVNEVFESREAAQAEIDRLGLADSMIVNDCAIKKPEPVFPGVAE